MVVKKKNKNPAPRHLHFSLIFVVIATIVAFYPSVGNDFVNWDDVAYLMNKDMIKTVSIDNLMKIFSSFFLGNYHPLTILSFSLDYSFFKMTAHGYHVHNLILHIINTVIVYFVTWHLFNKNNLTAFIASILFAIHPMHVESVAWVSERKDLLYTMYFLLAMLSYIFYDKTRKNKYLFFTLACFLLSLLSKAQAVTLPIVLLLIDYFLARKPDVRMFLEKIPFFALSLVFGILAILAQKAENSINPVGISVLNSLFYAQYSIWIYLLKLVLPVNLTCLYTYPFTAQGSVPFFIYLAPVIVIILLFLIVRTWKSQPAICFGLLFFLVVISPVLQFLPVGQAIVAERYSYIPYIGLFFILAILFSQLRERIKSAGNRKNLNYFGIGIILLLCILTWNRTKVWGDSVSLWTDAVEKDPKCMTAYINRSNIYMKHNKNDLAIQDCNDGLKIDSTSYDLYLIRGTTYMNMERYDLALKDYTRAIRIDPKGYAAYRDRGLLYGQMSDKLDVGISDFRSSLKLLPADIDGNYNLAVAYYKKRNYDSSMYYCKKTLELSPDYPGAHYVYAIISAAKQDFANAYLHGSRAQSLGYNLQQGLIDGWRKQANIVIPVLK